MNDENLSAFYSSLLPNLQKKGRRSTDVAEAVNKYQGLVQKVKGHGDRLSALLVSKRRLTEKKSVERSDMRKHLPEKRHQTRSGHLHL